MTLSTWSTSFLNLKLGESTIGKAPGSQTYLKRLHDTLANYIDIGVAIARQRRAQYF
jgi:hypothetical protein